MPPANSCPRCGRPSPSANHFCAHCGAPLSSTPSGKGWKLLLGVIALFAGLLWVSVIYTRPGAPIRLAGETQPRTLVGTSQNSNAPPVTEAAQTPPLALTSAQHLAEARRALADGYKPDKDPRKALWGEVAAAKWHLKAVAASAPEYREAQELLKEVARRERQIELARKQAEEDKKSDVAAEDVEDGEDSSASSSSSKSSTPSSLPTPRQSPPAGTAGGGGTSSDDYYTNSRGERVRRPTRSETGPPAGASAQCRDGTYSFSRSRRGTCSHHGGVARWL